MLVYYFLLPDARAPRGRIQTYPATLEAIAALGGTVLNNSAFEVPSFRVGEDGFYRPPPAANASGANGR